MHRMYMQMQIDPRLHNLWLQGCVGVLRAAWACHGAKVADLLQAAAAGGEPEQDDQGKHEEQEDQYNRNSQQIVRNLVSGFCSIVPNRAHGQGAAEGAQAQQGGEGGIRIRIRINEQVKLLLKAFNITGHHRCISHAPTSALS